MSRSNRRKKGSEEEGNSERWLITYSDLITLLMIFFILMYTMSRVDAQKYAAVANSLSMVLSGKAVAMLDSSGPSFVDGVSGQEIPGESGEQGQLDEIKEQIGKFMELEDSQASTKSAGQKLTRLGDNISIIDQERGLVISFKDSLLFGSGSDELTAQARDIITEVGLALTPIPNYIRVEGHTDNLPITTNKFPSNWELSVLRASNVVHVLQNDSGISPDRLSIIGYGEYRSLVPNEDVQSRAANRRVDIVILKKKYDYFEPPVQQTQ